MEEYQKLIPNIQPVSLRTSAIKYECYTWRFKGITLGLIAFYGIYERTEDAQFIRWRVNQFCEANHHHISGLIVDFLELEYLWGDDLEIHPHRLLRGGYPLRVVIHPEEVEPDIYATYVQAIDSEYLRTDISIALNEIHQLALEAKKKF